MDSAVPENGGINILTHLSLFSGVGGIDLAAHDAGFVTVGQCEIDDYATRVLEKNFPSVPRWKDIRDVTAESFKERTGLHTVDLISGGFPCQPFSVAGKQKGKGDVRYLWPDMLRVIRELEPRWVIGENVPGILRIAADDVCKDLEREGYNVGIFDYEAAAVGAPHRRERIFFVGNAKHNGLSAATFGGIFTKTSRDDTKRKKPASEPTRTSEHGNDEIMADTNDQRCEELSTSSVAIEPRFCGGSGDAGDIPYTNGEKPRKSVEHRNPARLAGFADSYWRTVESGMGGMVDRLPVRLDGCIAWPSEPDIQRVASGVKNRVDRLKCLGNAVVPAQVFPILRAIAIIESGAV